MSCRPPCSRPSTRRRSAPRCARACTRRRRRSRRTSSTRMRDARRSITCGPARTRRRTSRPARRRTCRRAARSSPVADGAAVVQRTEPMRFALTIPPGTDAGRRLADLHLRARHRRRLRVVRRRRHRRAARGAGHRDDLDRSGAARSARSGRHRSGRRVLQLRQPARRRATTRCRAPPMRGRSCGSRRASRSTTATARFSIDPSKIYFFGHSQGGLTGPAFVAFEPALTGAVLSGTGGLLYLSMLYKTAAARLPVAVETHRARLADGRGQPVARDRADVDRARRRCELRALHGARAAARARRATMAPKQHLPDRGLHRHVRAEPGDRGVRDRDRRRPRR